MRFWIFASCLLFLFACQDEPTSSEPQVQGVQTAADDDLSSIVRSPITADGVIDTINVAKMEFEETFHDFGKANEGDVLRHTFKFTNTGKVPLVIADARSTCGCTIPKYPEEPVAPGQGGEINVQFNTQGKLNKQQKPITITANTFPKKTVLQIKADVTPDPSRSEGEIVE